MSAEYNAAKSKLLADAAGFAHRYELGKHKGVLTAVERAILDLVTLDEQYGATPRERQS